MHTRTRYPRAITEILARRQPGRFRDAMDARTEHLIALVKDGATLKDAGRVYGISAERVRQLLKEGGMSARDLPGRAEKPRTAGAGRARLLAPVIEAMWRAECSTTRSPRSSTPPARLSTG
jgi:hypothetical protein